MILKSDKAGTPQGTQSLGESDKCRYHTVQGGKCFGVGEQGPAREAPRRGSISAKTFGSLEGAWVKKKVVPGRWSGIIQMSRSERLRNILETTIP